MFEPKAQREQLKAATVGDDRTIPAHEAVQPTQITDDVRARAEVEVVGVCQQDLRAQVAQLVRRDALDTAGRADDAEEWRFDTAMRRV